MRDESPILNRFISWEEVREQLDKHRSLKGCTLAGVDMTQGMEDLALMEADSSTVLLGCKLTPAQHFILYQKGCYLYTAPESLPYFPFRNQLYTWRELLKGGNGGVENSRDESIYFHFEKYRVNPPIQETLWQRIHDHSIDEALRALIVPDSNGLYEKECVGFMGGHGVLRSDPNYYRAARSAQLLAADGYFIVSGGGPGIMEASNLGAWMGEYTDRELRLAIDLLKQAPHYTSPGFHRTALQVLETFPAGKESLAIPTWFYGHEPSNVFATHIAKYFSNSIREDTLLAISKHGIVYAPGSAGTTQEIFMDAAQNHYGTYHYYSPMVFLCKKRYEIDTLIFPLLRQLAWEQPYFKLLHITDEPEDVLDFIQHNPPIPKTVSG
jgi:predicted Rossmann-fold nucleotide-binding protein